MVQIVEAACAFSTEYQLGYFNKYLPTIEIPNNKANLPIYQ